jgi:hypothetical protein
VKGKGIAIVLGGPSESDESDEYEASPEDAAQDEGIAISAEVIRCIKAADAQGLYDAFCALEHHLHMTYREEE